MSCCHAASVVSQERRCSRSESKMMRRTPRIAPRFLTLTERTGGLNPLAGDERIRLLSPERLSPVKGQRVPGLGRRMNSGLFFAMTEAVGGSLEN